MDAPRISSSVGVMMIVCAVLVDLIQFLVSFLAFIPFIGFILVIVINPLITFVASMIFGIWFSHFGVSLMESKRVFGFLSTMGLELIPGLDDLPAWTFFIAYTVYKERALKTDI